MTKSVTPSSAPLLAATTKRSTGSFLDALAGAADETSRASGRLGRNIQARSGGCPAVHTSTIPENASESPVKPGVESDTTTETSSVHLTAAAGQTTKRGKADVKGDNAARESTTIHGCASAEKNAPRPTSTSETKSREPETATPPTQSSEPLFQGSIAVAAVELVSSSTQDQQQTCIYLGVSGSEHPVSPRELSSDAQDFQTEDTSAIRNNQTEDGAKTSQVSQTPPSAGAESSAAPELMPKEAPFEIMSSGVAETAGRASSPSKRSDQAGNARPSAHQANLGSASAFSVDVDESSKRELTPATIISAQENSRRTPSSLDSHGPASLLPSVSNSVKNIHSSLRDAQTNRQSAQHPQTDALQLTPAPASVGDPGPQQSSVLVPPLTSKETPGQQFAPKDTGDVPRHFVREANPSSEETNGADLAGLSAIHAAKLIQTMKHSQMSVGMHSNDFGNISIRTSLSQQQMLAQISVDHSDLRNAIVARIPSLQSKIGDECGLHMTIDVNKSAHSLSGDPGQSSQRERAQSVIPHQSAEEVPEGPVKSSLRAPPGALDGSRLDIRA